MLQKFDNWCQDRKLESDLEEQKQRAHLNSTISSTINVSFSWFFKRYLDPTDFL